MAAEDCSSDHPFVSKLAEEGIHEDVEVKGETVSDAKILVKGTGFEGHEAVQEQCGSSCIMEMPVEGMVQTEVFEKELIPEVDKFVAENKEVNGVEGGGICDLPAKSTELMVERVETEIAKAEGIMEEPIEARGEELNEDSPPNTASDPASDVTVDEIVHDKIEEDKEANETADGTFENEYKTKHGTEVLGCMEVEQEESMKDDDDMEDVVKETIQANTSEEEIMKSMEYQDERNPKMYTETVPAAAVESKPEEQQIEEGFEYDPDQDKENEPPVENGISEQTENVGTEAEHNVAVEDVGGENIVSDPPLAEGEAFGDYDAKEQIKDGREGAEPEEKLIVEDAKTEIAEAKDTEQVADPADGASNVEYDIPTPEPEKAYAAGTKLCELVAMDQAAEVVEGEPNRVSTDLKAPEKTRELSTPGNDDVSAERIVREIDEAKQASRDEHEKEGEKHDSTDTQSTTIAMPSNEATNEPSGKLMSRVKSSLGKVRKAIAGRSPSTKIIIVDARLQEKVQ